LQSAIKEAERAIPYVKGSQIIRIEEIEEVYADAGKTPAFVAAEKVLSKDRRGVFREKSISKETTFTDLMQSH